MDSDDEEHVVECGEERIRCDGDDDEDSLFSLTDAVSVAVRGKKHSIILRPIKHEGGDRFFHLAKYDKKLERLFMHDADNRNEGYDIINALKNLRDAAVRKKVGVTRRERPNGTYIPIRYSSKKLKSKYLECPDVLEVDAPTVGNVEGVTMKILAGKASNGLWVELNDRVLTYLMNVMRTEEEAIGHDESHESVNASSIQHDNHGNAVIGMSEESQASSSTVWGPVHSSDDEDVD